MPAPRRSEPIRALLVEDSASDARLIDEMLTTSGRYELTWVKTLEEARNALTSRRWDVILLDLNLPDSTGLATLDHVVSARSAIPVVVLTVMDAGETGAEAVRRGAQDFLVKGRFHADDIDRAVRYATIRQSIARREATAFAGLGESIDLGESIEVPRAPLQKREPERFDTLARAFVQAIEEDVESIAFDKPASGWTARAAEELASVKAGPRDVIDLYLTAMNEAISHAETAPQRDATAQEARLRALELMGHLVAEYRGGHGEEPDA